MALTSADGVGDKVLGDWKNKREFKVTMFTNLSFAYQHHLETLFTLHMPSPLDHPSFNLVL